MKYNLDSLGPFAFQEMIQALMQKEISLMGTVFGTGKDGGREYMFEGEAVMPLSDKEVLNGFWIIQAKFKMPFTNMKDNFKWIKQQFEGEIKKFKNKTKKLRMPDNYIFISNVKLSGQSEVGEIDKLNEFADGFKSLIPNIHFILYDDICSLLENNRDVAISYSSFILPGDVLYELYNFYKSDKEKLNRIILTYLQKEFKYDSYSKLEQSGRQSEDNIKIENVFIDLFATESNIVNADLYHSQNRNKEAPFFDQNEHEIRFVERIVTLSNDSLRKCNHTDSNLISRQNKFVLIGSAGQGKSTLTQFLSQLFRAFFVNQNITQTPKLVNDFIGNLRQRKLIVKEPELYRLPFRIILSNYSEWISKRKKDGKPINILNYIKNELENDGDVIDIDDIRKIFRNLSTLIIFDGLDEVPASSNRNTIVSEIDRFLEIDLQNQNSDALIIITTRPQGFKDEFNKEKFTHLKIVELSKEDCRDYLSILIKLTENKPIKQDKYLNTLFRALEKESSSRLMRTPLDATIMATLVKRGGNPPEVKYNLYKEYYTTIFDREREKGVFELDKYKGAINSLHEYLGYKIQCNSELRKDSNKITRGDFLKEIKKYYLIQQFTEDEANEKTFILSNVLTDRLVMIAELTTDLDNPANNVIGFPVAPIQEYFASLFLVHENDKIIIERIKCIASSSYWRNVLLFMIGYFQNEGRSYLNDHIYIECQQNNELEIGTLKVGGWLAVDILIENIFSEVPKYENIFANELEDILALSPSNKHDYLLRLPEVVIIKHLKKYLEKELNQIKKLNKKLTTWKLLIQIPDLCIDLISKYWPNGDDEVELINFITNEKKLDYDFFIGKAIKRLNDLILDFKYDYDIHYLFTILSNSNKLSNNDKKIMIETLYLNNNYHFDIGMIIKIANNIKINESPYISDRKEELNFKIIKFSAKYSREILSYKQSSKTIEELKSIFEKYGIDYLAKLYVYYLNPKRKTINEFFLSIVNIDEIRFNKLKVIQKSWVLSLAFDSISNRKELKKIFTIINNNEFGDEIKWKLIEDNEFNNIDNTVIFNDLIYRYSDNKYYSEFSSFIEAFDTFYYPLIENKKFYSFPNLLRELIIYFIRVTLPINDSYHKTNVSFTSNNYHIIKSMVSILLDKNLSWDFFDFYTEINLYAIFLNCLFHNMRKEDFIKIISENKEIIFSRLSIASDNGEYPFYQINKGTYELLVNIFNITNEFESSMIRYVFLSTHINSVECKINTANLIDQKYIDSQNEISRLFILYQNGIYNDNHGNILIQLNELYPTNKYVAKYLIQLFSVEKFEVLENKKYINDFYKNLNEIEPDNYVLHSKLETIIREKIESTSSSFDKEDVKKYLNLDIK